MADPTLEFSDDELEAIPRDKRIRILQAQIDGGRAELRDLYKQLETCKVSSSELEYNLRELNAAISSEGRKLQLKQKDNRKMTERLKALRDELAQQETKLRQLGGDPRTRTGEFKDADLEKLVGQLRREQGNVLKLQAAIERRNNDLAAVDVQFKAEAEELKDELEALTQEKKKTLDLVSLEMQKLGQLRQRKVTALRSVASHALDSQLTAVLETIAEGHVD